MKDILEVAERIVIDYANLSGRANNRDIFRKNTINRLKSYRQSITEELLGYKDKPCMGVSQWKNHGIKYGYWDYFLKENKSTTRGFMLGYQSALSELEEKMPKRHEVDGEVGGFIDGNKYGFNDCLSQIKDIIKSMKK